MRDPQPSLATLERVGSFGAPWAEGRLVSCLEEFDGMMSDTLCEFGFARGVEMYEWVDYWLVGVMVEERYVRNWKE